MFSLSEDPHRRLNILTGEWVLVSPHRTNRPWQGAVEKISPIHLPEYDPTCYLCPRNERAGGVRNPDYTSTLVFENDFAALKPDTPAGKFNRGNLLVAEGQAGRCEVICFSPRHDLTLANMQVEDIRKVIDLWAARYAELGSDPSINYVEIFENRGTLMGASNPHPHCQVWSTTDIPVEPSKEQQQQLSYRQQNASCLLCDYVGLERSLSERVIVENDDFVALVPFWAVWPFESMIVSRRHVPDLQQLASNERNSLANILSRITRLYDGVFQAPFPYTMGFHQRPTDGQEHEEWHLHAHFYPPLLRSATIRKFMVGFELLANPQRDITPEAAAARLREIATSVGER